MVQGQEMSPGMCSLGTIIPPGARGALFLLGVYLSRDRLRKISFPKLSKKNKVFLITLVVMFLALAGLKIVRPWFTDAFTLQPYIMEFKPLAYLVMATVFIFAFESPSRKDFLRAGRYLGILLILDFIVESLLAGEFVRTQGSYDINYDAALLLIAYIVNKDDFWKEWKY